MATFNKISLSNVNDWVSVNTASSVDIGTALTLQNNSLETVLVSESASKPNIGAVNTLNLYSPEYTGLSIVAITSESLEIWVLPKSLGGSLNLSVQG